MSIIQNESTLIVSTKKVINLGLLSYTFGNPDTLFNELINDDVPINNSELSKDSKTDDSKLASISNVSIDINSQSSQNSQNSQIDSNSNDTNKKISSSIQKLNAIFIQDSDYRTSFKFLYNNQDTSDIELIAIEGDNQFVFHLHSLIVNKQSKYIEDKVEEYFTDVSNSNSINMRPKIILNDVSIKYLKSVIKYLYTGNMRCPTLKNIFKIYDIVKLLQINSLKNALLSFMATYLNVKEAILLIQHNVVQFNPEVFQVCMKLISIQIPIFSDISRNLVMDWNLKTVQRFIAECGNSIKEEDLFKTAAQYSFAHAIEYGMKPEIFFQKYFEPHLRYPIMSAEFIYNEVLPIRISKMEYIRDAFKYNAINPDLKKNMELVNFRCNPRSDSFITKYVFVDNSIPEFKISNNGLTAKYNGNTTFKTLNLNKLWDGKKIYYVEFKIEDTSNPSNIFIGINKPDDKPLGYAGQSKDGIQYYAYNGTIYRNSNSLVYGTKFGVNDTVGIYLDARDKYCKLKFFLNGKDLGESPHKDITLPLIPCVSLYNNLDCITITKKAFNK